MADPCGNCGESEHSDGYECITDDGERMSATLYWKPVQPAAGAAKNPLKAIIARHLGWGETDVNRDPRELNWEKDQQLVTYLKGFADGLRGNDEGSATEVRNFLADWQKHKILLVTIER